MKIFKALVQAPDLEWEFVDSSTVRAHQHSSGPASQEDQAIGKSARGSTTKIHMTTEAYGLPIDFTLSGGEVHDCKMAPEFIAALPIAQHTIADRGYDKEELRIMICNRPMFNTIIEGLKQLESRLNQLEMKS